MRNLLKKSLHDLILWKSVIHPVSRRVRHINSGLERILIYVVEVVTGNETFSTIRGEGGCLHLAFSKWCIVDWCHCPRHYLLIRHWTPLDLDRCFLGVCLCHWKTPIGAKFPASFWIPFHFWSVVFLGRKGKIELEGTDYICTSLCFY